MSPPGSKVANGDEHWSGTYVIPLVTSVIVAFGAVFAIGDRYLSVKEHQEFKEQILNEVHRDETIIDNLGKDKVSLLQWSDGVEQREREIIGLGDRVHRLEDTYLPRNEFDRWQKDDADRVAQTSNALKGYIDLANKSNEERTMMAVDGVQRRLEQVYALIRSLDDKVFTNGHATAAADPPKK